MINKKFKKAIVAASLIAVLGVGSTFAYLSYQTGSKTNTFTMGSGITGKTEEPRWNEENAKKFTPGRVIAKDPQIENTSADSTDPAYAAVKISYQKKVNDQWVETTFAELDQFINIQTDGTLGFNTGKWSMADNNTTAYYIPTLASKNSTAPIFTDVEIDPLALTQEQVANADPTNKTFDFDETKYEVKDAQGNVTSYTYSSYTMCDFQIEITGYLVQTEGFDNCQAAMTSAFSNVFAK